MAWMAEVLSLKMWTFVVFVGGECKKFCTAKYMALTSERNTIYMGPLLTMPLAF